MTTELTDQEKIALFRAMEDAWQAKQWRRCADMLAPDGVLTLMVYAQVGRTAVYQMQELLRRLDDAPHQFITQNKVGSGAGDGADGVHRHVAPKLVPDVRLNLLRHTGIKACARQQRRKLCHSLGLGT